MYMHACECNLQYIGETKRRLKDRFNEHRRPSLRSWRDFARECFCFGSEAVNASGETVRGYLKRRYAGYRRPIINPFCSYTPTAVSRHFLTSGHAEDHLILIPLEQLHTSLDSIRKAREVFLIHIGKTLEPAGLNRRDEM